MLDFLPLRGKRPVKGARSPHRASPRWCRERATVPQGNEGIACQFLHGDVDQALVSREIKVLQGPWGHLIGRGRPDARGGHRVVRLRRLTWGSISHGHSFGPFQGPFIVAFDRCGSILRLLRGDSTTVVDRRRPGVNPTPYTHKGAW